MSGQQQPVKVEIAVYDFIDGRFVPKNSSGSSSGSTSSASSGSTSNTSGSGPDSTGTSTS
uniref:Uncharacterized protein n=1 Tax=Kwoniella bestiolae CBS 10118 TaxID=1296100 RepID=A0A1B9G221_9TREE|nr:hypothetical protein I302_04871 [Kwoniella bestiolae CBS 10118]OCF25061.1 hypothetical protein I302_04871 [Kwoniella bestiolae CBS 10118]